MTWWRGQNLDRPIVGPDGTVWHFRVWAGHIGGILSQRIYFWDEAKAESGLLDLVGEQTLHVRRLKDRIKRLARDREYRSKFIQPLDFPIERYWPPDSA
jgi:hypothetical protein